MTALVVLGLLGLAIAAALVWRARQGRATAAQPAADALSEADVPPDQLALRDAERAVLDALAGVQAAAAERRADPARWEWVDGLLTDGYGVALLLEAESRRLEREIDELLDSGGAGVEAAVSERMRGRRDLDRRARQLRARLDLVHLQTHTPLERPE